MNRTSATLLRLFRMEAIISNLFRFRFLFLQYYIMPLLIIVSNMNLGGWYIFCSLIKKIIAEILLNLWIKKLNFIREYYNYLFIFTCAEGNGKWLHNITSLVHNSLNNKKNWLLSKYNLTGQHRKKWVPTLFYICN